MEIIEIQSKLAELEAEISKLLLKFHFETGCSIKDVSLEILGITYKDVPLYSVDIEVTL